MRNRFCASFRMAENAKRTPELTRKVKNCNVPRNKMKSAIFWQNSYRLEWYLIICHYLNLYVHCISFITRLFLICKLTGAKSNFETMFLQERNLWKFVQSKTKVKDQIQCLIDEGGEIYSDDREIAQQLNSFFKSVFTGKFSESSRLWIKNKYWSYRYRDYSRTSWKTSNKD